MQKFLTLLAPLYHIIVPGFLPRRQTKGGFGERGEAVSFRDVLRLRGARAPRHEGIFQFAVKAHSCTVHLGVDLRQFTGSHATS